MTRAATSALLIASVSAAGLFCALSQDSAAPPAASIPTKDLTDEQLAAGLVATNPLALPSPPELLYVLSKNGSPRWRKLYHPVLQGQESDRTKTTLRLGLSIAEAHLATMARDSQKIRDVTNDMQRYANILGIRDGMTERAREINRLAESKAWARIAFELESLVTETSEVLRAQRDPDLANLITTGMWVRLLHISTCVVTEEDFPDTSLAVSSHWTLEQLVAPHLESKSPVVTSLRDQLAKIGRLWSPGKRAIGHKFDDALIEDTRTRLRSVLNLFTR